MILVVGSTGQLGGMIAHRLLAEGKHVRILVHPDSDYDDLAQAGCEPSLGDIKYQQSFGPAFHGVETVITTASAIDPQAMNDSFQRLDVEGNRNLIDAAHAAGVRQFIFVSSLGSDPAHPDPYFRAKGQTEAYLRISGMPYTILAAAPSLETWIERLVQLPMMMGQPVSVVGSGTRRHALISRVDLAAFATAVIGHPAALNATIALGGPEMVSWLEVVDRLGEVMGQTLPVQHYSPGVQLPGLRPTVSRVAATFDTFDYVVDIGPMARTFGVTLTPLDVTLSRIVGELAFL